VIALKIDKGYGFLAPDKPVPEHGTGDLFFHASDILPPLVFEPAMQERRVAFEFGRDRATGRPRAMRVREL
jgi:cold shock CspA family protein